MFSPKIELTSGISDLTSKKFYYVKVQSVLSKANFELTRGMNLLGGISKSVHALIAAHVVMYDPILPKFGGIIDYMFLHSSVNFR